MLRDDRQSAPPLNGGLGRLCRRHRQRGGAPAEDQGRDADERRPRTRPACTHRPEPLQPRLQGGGLLLVLRREVVHQLREIVDQCGGSHRGRRRSTQAVEDDIIRRLGGLFSPYTGKEFDSKGDTDIEHIVARSEAHDSGLCRADASTRRAFSRDLLNLTLASPRVNRPRRLIRLRSRPSQSRGRTAPARE